MAVFLKVKDFKTFYTKRNKVNLILKNSIQTSFKISFLVFLTNDDGFLVFFKTFKS